MRKKIKIDGMSCKHCTKNVKEVLSEISGVFDVNVNIDGKYAIILTNKDVEYVYIKYFIDDAGYRVVGIETF